MLDNPIITRMSSELEFLLSRPDFEKQCDSFVSEIMETLPMAYPDLVIYAENQTKENINAANNAGKFFKSIQEGSEKEKLVRYMQRIGDREDEKSAFSNKAVVDIISLNKEYISQIPKAEMEVFEIVEKYNPNEQRVIRDQDNHPYSVRLTFTFFD